MKHLTLSTTQPDPLHLYTGRLVGDEHLPGAVAAQVATAPRARLLAWSVAEAGLVGFSQNAQNLILPFPLVGAGIGIMKPAKARGYVTLFVSTAEQGVISALGSPTFQQATLDGLLAQQDALAALLGCSVTVEDWGYDC